MWVEQSVAGGLVLCLIRVWAPCQSPLFVQESLVRVGGMPLQAFQLGLECVPVPQALEGDVVRRWQVRRGCLELWASGRVGLAVLPECIGATPVPFLGRGDRDPEPWPGVHVVVFVVIRLHPGSLRVEPIVLGRPAPVAVQLFRGLCLRDQFLMVSLLQHPDHEVASCSWHVGYGASHNCNYRRKEPPTAIW